METVMLPTVATDTIALPVKESPIPNPRLVDMRMSGASVVPSQTKTATTLAPETFQKVSSTPSFISQTKTIAFGNHEALVFPSPPGNRARRRYERSKAARLASYTAMLESLPKYQLDKEHNGMEGRAISLLEEQVSATKATMELALKTDLEAIGEITCPYCFHAFPAQDVFDDGKWRYVSFH